jgi:cyclic pyranopterin phosphate synthase
MTLPAMAADLDGQKLLYHPARVAAWAADHPVGPITVELSPTSACNQRCVFCGFDYRRSPHAMSGAQLEALGDELVKGIPLMRLHGVTIAGEGEPTLVSLASLVERLSSASLRIGLMTNGMNDSFLAYLKHLTWIRFSINASRTGTYSYLHGVPGQRMLDVMALIKETASKKSRKCTLGVQSILLPENATEVMTLAHDFATMGVDYYVVKPYTKHPQSSGHPTAQPEWFNASMVKIRDYFKTFRGHTKVIFRSNAFRAAREGHSVRGCPAANFFHFIAANGGVYACNQDVGIDSCCIGNVFADPWERILKDERRRTILQAYGKRDCSRCRHACRLYAANEYLDRVKRPSPHDAFI